MTPRAQQRIGRSSEDSEEFWPPTAETTEGRPNVLVVLLDDVGFSQLGCFGSSIETPHMNRLATRGLRYTNFHTTAVCSPTRASLLTGRNCHSVGFGHVTERLAGYPGYSMRLPEDSATLAEVLSSGGYSTRAVGKWHLTPSYETGPQGPFDRWPLARGFDRFYGFLTGSTDQFEPELVRDNSPVDMRAGRPDGYHLSGDLVDESIRQIGELQSAAPLRPFFLYLALGACHAPHQAPREFIDHYRGRFDHGWDVERERVLARQVELGIFLPEVCLGDANPGVRPWAELDDDERRLFARMMEAYAGFLTYTDAQLGRLLDHLEETSALDNTLVALFSDNGASGEGGPEGSVDEGLYLNDRPQTAADGLRHLDELGGPALYNHYPWGWAQAGNTPFRWYKQFTHAGGITNGLILHWPDGGLPAGELRSHYHHVIDLMPTILDLTDVERPSTLRGVTQAPMHGVSMRSSIEDPTAPGTRYQQHYEMWGNRGLWQDGWMAICRLHPDAAGAPQPTLLETAFKDLTWELYDHRTDPTECHDLAEQRPDKLRELVDLWWAAAGRYAVLPVDVRPRSQRWPSDPPRPVGTLAGRTVFQGSGGPFERGVSPRIAGTSFRLSADIEVGDAPVEGGLYQLGARHGGYCWYIRDGVMAFEVSPSSIETRTFTAPLDLGPGNHRLDLVVRAADSRSGALTFLIDEEVLHSEPVTGLLKRVPVGSGRTHVGRAPAATASGALPRPFDFTGLLRRLTVTVGDDAWMSLPEELKAEMRDQ